MTLSQIQKIRSRSGVTLVELLVVILIVAILAVTMLPMFKKYVVQAQYAAEPIPLVGHIRTQIGLYQYEHNELPWTLTIDSASPQAMTFAKNTGGTAFDAIKYNLGTQPGSDPFGGKTPYAAMDISVNELTGKKISPDQVHFACVANGANYGYAIGIFGKGGDGLPQNTGYAVAEYYFSDVIVSGESSGTIDSGNKEEKGYKFVATWKNYTGDSAVSGQTQFYFDKANSDGVCYIPDMSTPPAASDTLDTLFAASGFIGSSFGAATCGSWEYVNPVK